LGEEQNGGVFFFFDQAHRKENTVQYIADRLTVLSLFSQFNSFADSLRNHIQRESANLNWALQEASDQVTVKALSANETFPFTTLQLYEVTGRQARRAANLTHVSLVLIVSNSEREKWNQYSVDNQGWIQTSRNQYAAASLNDEYLSSGRRLQAVTQNRTYNGEAIPPFIFARSTDNVIRPSQGLGPYFALWQTSPPPIYPQDINLDVATIADLDRLVLDGMQHNQMSFSSVTNTDILFRQNTSSPTSQMDLSQSFVIHPVYQGLKHAPESIVGFILSAISWKDYLSYDLPNGLSSVTAVLSNSLGQQFTYKLSGKEVGQL
jgi:hypothetical protein